MPRLGQVSQMVQHKTANFQFSAVRMEDLQSSRYTLVALVLDRSGSTDGFQKEMEAAVGEVIAACSDEHNPFRDNLLIRVVRFDHQVQEVHGFKLVSTINPSDYAGSLAPGGSTALYDATIDGVESLMSFGKDLIDQDYTVNGILVVVTDGDENCSTLSVPGPNGTPDPKNVKQAFMNVKRKECLESLHSILIGVNDPRVRPQREFDHFKQCLDRYHQEAGFAQFVCLDEANKKTLMKLAQFISQSISSQSQHLGTGGPSQPVAF